ncbi:MAG: hypothetical protein ACI9CD_000776 [Candidatus Deianiraeaceae bacterium]|jgi:hypothetical protein
MDLKDCENEIDLSVLQAVQQQTFNKDEADHEFALKRIQIARWTICIASFLLFCALLALVCLTIEDKNHLLSAYISSLFGTVTLTLGFIAGSSIDK